MKKKTITKTPKQKKNVFNSKKLAAAMIAKREAENITVRAVTKSHGIPLATFLQIEANSRIPRADTLAKVCNWLDVPVQTFFNP